ncbi:MAG TPA: tRNA pseudouridine(54/55) synthase Pus10 [Methanobacteriaceae archaeon]|nr:tRNA pseudouridine(54/55) synthase Pus10 [Methanobacteriaceae archaeon]
MDTHIKEKAQKIKESTAGEICNHCLGRKFSKELEGPGNPRRGVQIREIMSLEGYEFSSPEKCSICGGLFQNLEKAAEKVENKINKLDLEYSSFLVGSKVDPDVIKKDENLNQTLEVEVESIKREINRELGKILEERLQREVDFDYPQLVINADFSAEEPKIHIQINPLFLEGRYRKLIRGIPQTKWPCRKCRGRGCESCNFTGKMYLETVEELISGPVLKMSKGKDSKFHGAGREDIDVKMLGSGRPFVLEIKEPRRRVLDLEKLEKEINETAKGKVEVLNLKYTVRSRKAEIKTSSPDTYKIYQAYVDLEKEIIPEDLKKLENLKEIKQRTPIRVSHRRADKIRTREVMEIKWEIIDPKTIKLIIKGQGGLYIKELISGDEERTQPNVSQVLGTSARCVELDVLEVGI